ncbi:MAG: aspartate/glutamate racemase family protein [bacterium]|nr:aspartate/glutamate racemase family protein [bacterium]
MKKIGIFDSGVGGLIMARAIQKMLPKYDYVYLGDTARVPYGNRSHETILGFTKECVQYLFEKENCGMVIVACNTASARALREIQREFTPTQPPPNLGGGGLNIVKAGGGRINSRKILGVLIPSAEEASKYERVGIIATRGTVTSKTFEKEIKKINPNCKVFQNPAPLLVPLAEEGEKLLVKKFLEKYLAPFLKQNIDALVLGCTHYPIFKNEIKKVVGKNVKIISQDEIIPKKLKEYFVRHPDISQKLSQKGTAKILVTDITQNIESLTAKWFGQNVKPKLININKIKNLQPS